MSSRNDDRDEDSFNLSRAELFEALGHPTRIRLLEILRAKPTTFSELKRAAEIESNGLLGFHLGKLTGIIKLNSDGLYSLTDEGKEALRIVEATTLSRRENGRHGSSSSSFLSVLSTPFSHLRYRRTLLLAILLIAIIALGLVAMYQQQQITGLRSSTNSSIVSIDGKEYRYYVESLSDFMQKGSLHFDGVNFSISPASQIYTSNSTGYVQCNNSTNSCFISISGFGHCSSANSCTFSINFVPPNIDVNFGNGYQENWNHTTSSSSTLWFSQHSNPRAGISYDQNTGLLIFYVSS